MPQILANGMSLEYDQFGDKCAPAIVLVMGLGGQLIGWPEPFCQGLGEHGFRVIRFDNRDIGLSTKFDGVRIKIPLGQLDAASGPDRSQIPYTLDDMARDTAGLIEALHASPAHVVGISMGGMIAQLVAADHPARVRTLTSIMSTSGNPDLPAADPQVARQVFAGLPRDASREAMIDYHVQTAQMIGSPGYPVREQVLRERVRLAIERSYYPQGFVRQHAAIRAGGSRVEALERITAPTLVIHGSADRLVPPAGGIDTAAHIKNAKLEMIEGMGHDLPPRLLPRLVELIAAHAAAFDRGQPTTP